MYRVIYCSLTRCCYVLTNGREKESQEKFKKVREKDNVSHVSISTMKINTHK